MAHAWRPLLCGAAVLIFESCVAHCQPLHKLLCMENDTYTDVLSHYDEADTASDKSGGSSDSWVAGEARTGLEGLKLDEEDSNREREVEGGVEDVTKESEVEDHHQNSYTSDHSEELSVPATEDSGIEELVPEAPESDEETVATHSRTQSVVSEVTTSEALEMPDAPRLAHPDVSITRDPSISSRITSEIDIFSTRTPSVKQGPPMGVMEGELAGFEAPHTRTTTMTSSLTAQFQPPDNMGQFVHGAGYSESVYSNDDAVSEFSYMPNDDKPWEMGYQGPPAAAGGHGAELSRAPTTSTFATNGPSIMQLESQLNHNRAGFGNEYDSVDVPMDDASSVADNATLCSDATTTNEASVSASAHDTSFNTTGSAGARSVASATPRTSVGASLIEFKETPSVMPILEANVSDQHKIARLRELRVEQSHYDTSLACWLTTQMELAKNTVACTQREFSANVKTALNTDYTGGATANIGLGYGLSAGLDSTKSRVADVGEGLQRGMLSLSKVARGIVRRREKSTQ